METSVKIAELLGNLSKPIPLAGGPLEAIFGSTKVVLEMLQKARAPEEDLTVFAIRCGELTVEIESQMLGRWDNMSIHVKDKLYAIQEFLVKVEKFYIKQSSLSSAKRLLCAGKTSKKISKFTARLDELQRDFNTIVLLDSSVQISDIQHIAHAHFDMTQNLMRLFTQGSTVRSRTAGIGFQEFEEIVKDECIALHQFEDIELVGDPIIEQPSRCFRCRRRYGYIQLLVGRNMKTMRKVLVKKWSGKTELIHKKFKEDLLCRVKLRDPRLLQLIGIVPSKSQPTQVYHLEADQNIPFVPWMEELVCKDEETAVIGFAKFVSAVQELNNLLATKGIGIPRIYWGDERFQNVCKYLLAIPSKTSREFKIVYFGDLKTNSEQNTDPIFFPNDPFYRHFQNELLNWLTCGLSYSWQDVASFKDIVLQSDSKVRMDTLRRAGWLTQNYWGDAIGDLTPLRLGDIYIKDKHGDIDVLDNLHESISLYTAVERKLQVGQGLHGDIVDREVRLDGKGSSICYNLRISDLGITDRLTMQCHWKYQTARAGMAYLHDQGEDLLHRWGGQAVVDELCIVNSVFWLVDIKIDPLVDCDAWREFVIHISGAHKSWGLVIDVIMEDSTSHRILESMNYEQRHGTSDFCNWSLNNTTRGCRSIQLPNLNMPNLKTISGSELVTQTASRYKISSPFSFGEILLSCVREHHNFEIDHLFSDIHSDLGLPMSLDSLSLHERDATQFELTFHFSDNPLFNNRSLTAIFSGSTISIPVGQTIDSKSSSPPWGRKQLRRWSNDKCKEISPSGVQDSIMNLFYDFNEEEMEPDFYYTRYRVGQDIRKFLKQFHRDFPELQAISKKGSGAILWSAEHQWELERYLDNIRSEVYPVDPVEGCVCEEELTDSEY